MPTICTRAEAKDYLQISHTDDDAFIDAILQLVTDDIVGHCHQDFTEVSRTERINGDTENLVVGHTPIDSITSVKDYAIPASPVTILAANYDFDSVTGEVYGVVVPVKWGTGRRRWEVIYVGGIDGFPTDVKLAAYKIIAAVYSARDPKIVKDVLGDSEMFVEGNLYSGLAQEVHSVLSRHVETGF